MRNENSRVPDFNSFRTHSGDKHHIDFDSRFRPDGTIDLVESGRRDIQKEINSHAAETDIAMIVARLQMGDTSAVNARPGMYGDFTNFPKTYSDMLELVHRSEEAFLSLPLEIRSKYNNDKNQWFASAGSESWLIDMGIIKPVEKPVEKPVVKETNNVKA